MDSCEQERQSHDDEEEVERRQRAANVAEGEKILAEIRRVEHRQQYWKGVLEEANRTEAEQGSQMAALSKEVLLEEVLSLENEEFVRWIAERDRRHGRGDKTITDDHIAASTATAAGQPCESDASLKSWREASAAILANDGAAPPHQRIATLKTEPDDVVGLNSWYHRDELALETPFSALVPFPRKLTAEGRSFFVDAVNGLFDEGGVTEPLYVSTISELCPPSQLVRLLTSKGCGQGVSKSDPAQSTPYTQVPCISGDDVLVVVSRYNSETNEGEIPLSEALIQTPCVFLSHRPLEAIEVAKLAIVGGCLVAAEVYPSERRMRQVQIDKSESLAAVRRDLEEFAHDAILSHMPGRTLLALAAQIPSQKRPSGYRWVLLNIGCFSGCELSCCFTRRDIFTIAHSMQLMAQDLQKRQSALDAVEDREDPFPVDAVQRCVPPTVRYYYDGVQVPCTSLTMTEGHSLAKERLAAMEPAKPSGSSKEVHVQPPQSALCAAGNQEHLQLCAAAPVSPGANQNHSTTSLVVAAGVSAVISTGIAVLLMSRRKQ